MSIFWRMCVMWILLKKRSLGSWVKYWSITDLILSLSGNTSSVFPHDPWGVLPHVSICKSSLVGEFFFLCFVVWLFSMCMTSAPMIHVFDKGDGDSHGPFTILKVNVDSLSVVVDDRENTRKQFFVSSLLTLVFPQFVIPNNSVVPRQEWQKGLWVHWTCSCVVKLM